MKRGLYRNRPDWTTQIRYWNGHVDIFNHCGQCLGIVPTGELRCKHCVNRAEKQKANFEAFLKTKEEESLL